MTLTSSFRFFGLYNGLVKSMKSASVYNQLRDVHLQCPMLKEEKKKVEEKLGLPTKPKRPPTPYFRYLHEEISSVQAKHPSARPTEHCRLVGKQWHSIDDERKNKLIETYKVERLKYLVELTKYKKALSDDDKNKIKEMNAQSRERKFKIKEGKITRNMGKPKRPPNPFMRYVQEQYKNEVIVNRKREYALNHFRQVIVKWKALSDAEKEKYRSPEESESYKKAMNEWELEMIRLGRQDLIRNLSWIAENLPTSK